MLSTQHARRSPPGMAANVSSSSSSSSSPELQSGLVIEEHRMWASLHSTLWTNSTQKQSLFPHTQSGFSRDLSCLPCKNAYIVLITNYFYLFFFHPKRMTQILNFQKFHYFYRKQTCLAQQQAWGRKMVYGNNNLVLFHWGKALKSPVTFWGYCNVFSNHSKQLLHWL